MVTKERNINNFYEYCLTTCSPKRLNKIKWILDYAKESTKKDLFKLKVGDIVKFLSDVNQSDFKAWTKNDYKKIFKRFVKWCYQDLDMIEGDKVKQGFKGVSQLRARNKEKINKNNLIKPEELEKLIRTAKSLKWKALISFAYESAFRPCEIRALTWNDLRFDDSLSICRVSIISPKTNNQREIPVKDCVVHLKRWKEEYQFKDRIDKDFVFPSQHHRDKQMGDGVMSQMFMRLSKEAKIRHIFPYLLRHTRIYEIQKRLGDTRISSKFGGHSIETSELYNHLDSDDVEESMLKEIYTTKELTEEQKNKYDEQMDKQEQELENIRKELKFFRGMSQQVQQVKLMLKSKGISIN